MKKHFFYLVVICAFVLSPISIAESISGNQYLSLSEKEKGWYILGLLDGMKNTRDSYFTGSQWTQSDFTSFFESCISGRPVRQHMAIFDLWLKENPVRWNEQVIALFFEAERDSCAKLAED